MRFNNYRYFHQNIFPNNSNQNSDPKHQTKKNEKHIKGPKGIYSPLLMNLNIKPKSTKTALTRNDKAMVTSNPSNPSHIPLIAKSLVSPPPIPGFPIINLTT